MVKEVNEGLLLPKVDLLYPQITCIMPNLIPMLKEVGELRAQVVVQQEQGQEIEEKLKEDALKMQSQEKKLEESIKREQEVDAQSKILEREVEEKLARMRKEEEKKISTLQHNADKKIQDIKEQAEQKVQDIQETAQNEKKELLEEKEKLENKLVQLANKQVTPRVDVDKWFDIVSKAKSQMLDLGLAFNQENARLERELALVHEEKRGLVDDLQQAVKLIESQSNALLGLR